MNPGEEGSQTPHGLRDRMTHWAERKIGQWLDSDANPESSSQSTHHAGISTASSNTHHHKGGQAQYAISQLQPDHLRLRFKVRRPHVEH